MASNGTADTLQVLHSVPRPSLMGAEEESPKRVASEAKSPAGPPEGAVFEELFGRAKSSPPEAECPKGEKARAAGPEKTPPQWAEKTLSKKGPGRMAQKKHSQLNKPRPEGKKNPFQKKPGPQAHKNILII